MGNQHEKLILTNEIVALANRGSLSAEMRRQLLTLLKQGECNKVRTILSASKN